MSMSVITNKIRRFHQILVAITEYMNFKQENVSKENEIYIKILPQLWRMQVQNYFLNSGKGRWHTIVRAIA